MPILTLNLLLTTRETQHDPTGLKVELWEYPDQTGRLLSTAKSNAEGNVTFPFSSRAARRLLRETERKLYFKVFDEDGLLLDTRLEEPPIFWQASKGEQKIELQLPPIDMGRNRRSVSYPIRLLNTGNAVAALHHALRFIGLLVARPELSSQKYGRSTLRVVTQFQADNQLEETGVVDEATAKKLNEILETQGYFKNTPTPLRARFLKLKSNALNDLDDERTKAHVRGKLYSQLAESLIAQFKDASDELKRGIQALQLDLESIQEKELREVIREDVLPVLLNDSTLHEELDKLDEDTFKETTGTIKELLHLDKSLRDNPLFAREARRARNMELVHIAAIPESKRENIAELDLQYLDRSRWLKLVEEETLKEDEAKELFLTVEFAKLVDDDFELVSALKTGVPQAEAEPVQDTLELVTWSKEKWVNVFRERNTSPPEEDDLDSFAENIMYNLQLTFPTPYFLHRTVPEEAPDQTRSIDQVVRLMERNEQIFERNNFEALDLEGIDDGEQDTLKVHYVGLQGFANTYKGLGISRVISPPNELEEGEQGFLTTETKQAEINRRLGLLQTFRNNNPGIDLRATYFYRNVADDVPETLRVNLTGIDDEADQDMVLLQMRSFQRVQYLGENFDTAEKLLKNGFDSARGIIKLSEDRLVDRLKEDLDEAEIRRVYRKAERTAIKSVHLLTAMEENRRDQYSLGGLRQYLGTNDSHFQDVPGFDDLFGSQNYCACKHCRSIFSPAAYFVDMMQFIQENITEPHFTNRSRSNHSINLRVRRPDLWTLALTCDNTNQMIPYLDIVLEVLEEHIRVNNTSITGFENLNDVYALLAEAESSFQQPFNLQLERLRLYLGHFNVSLLEIYELFGASVQARNSERLGISIETFRSLIQTDHTVARGRFSTPFDGPVRLVRNFMKDTGLTRREVTALLETNVISSISDLGIRPYGPRVEEGQDEQTAIFESLGHGLEEQIIGLPVTRGSADLVYQWFYFFVRVRRAVSWTIPELDWVIGLLTTVNRDFTYADFTYRHFERLLIRIANFRRIQERLGISIEQVLILADSIPAEGPDNMFERLYSPGFILEGTPVWLEQIDEEHYTFRAPTDEERVAYIDSSPEREEILANLPAPSELFAVLQAALGIPAQDLQRLNGLFRGGEVSEFMSFDLSLLTQYSRYAIVSKSLGLSIHDLNFIEAQLLEEEMRSVPAPGEGVLDHVQQIVKEVEQMESLPIDMEEVRLLITGRPTGRATYAFGLEQMRSLIDSLPTDNAIYFTAEKLAETGDMSSEDSILIINEMVAQGLLERLRIYRLDDRFATLGGVDMDAIERVWDDPTTEGIIEINPVISNNREAIQRMIDRNHLQVVPNFLTEVNGIDPTEAASIIETLERERILIPVEERFRLSDAWNPASLDLLATVVTAFEERAESEGVELRLFRRLEELVAAKSEAIRDLLNPYYNPLPEALSNLLGISRERFAAIVSLLNPVEDFSFVRNLEVLFIRINEFETSESEGVSSEFADARTSLFATTHIIERAQRLVDAFELDDVTIRFLRTGQRRFAFGSREELDAAGVPVEIWVSVFNWNTIQLLNTFSTLLQGKDAEERKRVCHLVQNWDGTQRVELAWAMNTTPAQFIVRGSETYDPNASLGVPLLDEMVVPFQQKVLALRDKLRIDGKAFKDLNAETYETLKQAADIALHTIQANFDEDALERVLGPIEDKLRSLKRDALVDFMITHDNDYRFQDEKDLMQYILMDPLMEGCGRISRIKAAILSLQLYVHYVRMGLERAAPPSEVGPRRRGFTVSPSSVRDEDWLWRKNYRVWEANRRVFVYPECYLEEDLRDNKTELFEEFESFIFQEDSSNVSIVERGVQQYLNDLRAISKLHATDCFLESGTYFIFGHTGYEPYRYYWITYSDSEGFSNWSELGIEINANRVTPYIFEDKLYIFWVETTPQLAAPEDEEEGVLHCSHSFPVKYSCLGETGEWSVPIELKGDLFNPILPRGIGANVNPNISRGGQHETSKLDEGSFLNYLHSSHWYQKLYVYELGNGLLGINYVFETNFNDSRRLLFTSAEINLFEAKLEHAPSRLNRNYINAEAILRIKDDEIGIGIFIRNDWYRAWWGDVSHFEEMVYPTLNFYLNDQDWMPDRFTPIVDLPGNMSSEPQLVFVENYQNPTLRSESILQVNKEYFLVLNRRSGHFRLSRLSSILPEQCAIALSRMGLEGFLEPANQNMGEADLNMSLASGSSIELELPGKSSYPDYSGVFGVYFQELFFHMLLFQASYLNSTQKFERANWWFRKIFDPTKSDPWQYLGFRDVDPQTLYEMLTNEDAVRAYENDPFNPHAIARLRPSAYMKSVIMKYIDNTLDWGDKLFTQDTFESINEALMLYIHAADLLGEKPYEIGECAIEDEEHLTFEQIERSGSTSGILTELEFFSAIVPEIHFSMPNEPTGNILSSNSSGRESINNYQTTRRNRQQVDFNTSPRRRVSTSIRSTVRSLGSARESSLISRRLAFCVPQSDWLLQYWDRVNDRIFKIRNCQNIDGVRRQLPLFQPRIDPMLLVRARAAGLSLEDILDMLAAKPPAYRFSYLIEKGKEFVRTVQSYGASLLSALEKKDVEELTLLRSVHERELLDLVQLVKKETVREAEENVEVIMRSKATAEARRQFYLDLIEESVNETYGYDKREEKNLNQQEKAKRKQRKAANFDLAASIVHAAPSGHYTRGRRSSPESTPGPFSELTVFSYGTSNVAAALTAKANVQRRSSTMASLSAGITSTKSGYHRRKQEWENQVVLTTKELEQIDQQILAAEVRLELTQKDLGAHQRQMEQSDELYSFYKGKFTNMGLYTFMSTQMTRLYRQAYNMALDMARQAERAYHFERDEQVYFIKNDNWDTNKAGLLAGEGLLLQLQQMEKSYLEKNLRDYEINQSFSLLQLAPGELIQLKERGDCQFTIPETAYDLLYPGYYKRFIKSVRISIPCVTGPYTNVGCKLTLLDSQVRRVPNLHENPVAAPKTVSNSIATSTANNDGGVFELNFRDERYLPFEGAGAIESRWALQLPNEFRAFDYNTISDVVIHVSYTAKFDGGLRSQVEEGLRGLISLGLETDTGVNLGFFRTFSLKHEFGSALHELLSGSGSATFQVHERHFPMWLVGRTMRDVQFEAKIVVTNPDAAISNNHTLDLSIGGQDLVFAESRDDTDRGPDRFPRFISTREAFVELTNEVFGEWAISINPQSGENINLEDVDNIILIVRYGLDAV